MTESALNNSDKTFLGLVLLMGLGKVIWTCFGVDHPIVQNWTGVWSAIIPSAFFGFIAIKLAEKTGFPDIWDEKVSNIQRFLYPVLLGFGFAIIEILVQPGNEPAQYPCAFSFFHTRLFDRRNLS